jgi:hypothetical protein
MKGSQEMRLVLQKFYNNGGPGGKEHPGRIKLNSRIPEKKKNELI